MFNVCQLGNAAVLARFAQVCWARTGFITPLHNLKGKVAVVLGATGVVGSGAVHNFLASGATVVAVSRDKTKVETLAKKFGNKQLLTVVHGDYSDEKAGAELRKSVLKVLPKGAQVDHVVAALGFNPTTDGGPVKTGTAPLKTCFDDALYPVIISAQAFLPEMQKVEGSTFSMVSGGLAHFCSDGTLQWWTATVKNAAINGLFLALVAEHAKHKVRVANFCIHFGVAYAGDSKNQWGMDGADTNDLGKAFTAFASTSAVSQQYCLTGIDKLKEQVASIK